MARQTLCDITKAVISDRENVGGTPVVVTMPHSDVELVVVARCRPDGSRPDLTLRGIRTMVERGELRPAPELPHLHLVATDVATPETALGPRALTHRRGA